MSAGSRPGVPTARLSIIHKFQSQRNLKTLIDRTMDGTLWNGSEPFQRDPLTPWADPSLLSRPITLSRRPTLITEMGQIVVITGECPSRPGIHVARVRHRTLPEVFGEGATTREAAEDLVRKLMRESSSVSGWHLTDLERVIADIQVFLDQSAEPSVA